MDVTASAARQERRLAGLVHDLPPWARLAAYAVGVTGALVLEAVEGPAALALIGIRVARELHGHPEQSAGERPRARRVAPRR
ncbi:MAG TPA: hypothetical protein VGQ42_00425 [Candidatus Dormibacteraeota bacterium]|nr:hypothetical protein [Candidatus Dormibacteraeota bacterium]